MKEQIDKLIKSGNGKIKKILMSDKAFKQFCKEEFENTELFNTVLIRNKCNYNKVEILNIGNSSYDVMAIKPDINETDISLF